ncbi:hypothetical protein RCS94_08015 [Orbaceae bacterium ac157xtp]
MLRFFSILLMLITVGSTYNSAYAKTDECLLQPQYDIVINSQKVDIITKNTLSIDTNGQITFNGLPVQTSAKRQIEAKELQNYLRQQLPAFELKSHNELNNIKDVFAVAIRDKLGNKSDLIDHLNTLYNTLNVLLNNTIHTEDGTTYFNHQAYSDLKPEGEKMGKKVFYSIIGESIIKLNIFKNYSGIKKIAKQEWKQQKPRLKEFDSQVCQLLTSIDDKYNHLMVGLSLKR